MALAPRNKAKVRTKPYYHNEHIVCHPSILEGDNVIEYGDKIKFTGVRGTFRFIKHVVNTQLEVEWIDCMNNKTGEYRSFYVSRLKHKAVKRRQRRQHTGGQAACSKCGCVLDETTASPSIIRRGSGYCRKCMKEYLNNRRVSNV